MKPVGAPWEELAAFCLRLPKVELHVHLEGTMRPATLLRLARKHGVDLPADDEIGLHRWFKFRDFPHFVEIYLLCSKCVREPEDFQLLVRDFLSEQARQSVFYSEVHFTIGTHLANGANGSEVADALAEAMDDGAREFGARMKLIPDIIRNVGAEAADATLEWALENRSRGVVALGLTGFESEPNEPFRGHFAAAAAEGLHCVAHAGEHGGPDSVRSVLEVCRAERIGHGVRAMEDSSLVAELAELRVPLEVCPTSNVCLGVSPDLTSHPFERMREGGLVVSVNSDDPPFFNTTLTDEYVRLAQTFGYRREVLVELAMDAIDQTFLEPSAKEELRARFEARIAELEVPLPADDAGPAHP